MTKRASLSDDLSIMLGEDDDRLLHQTTSLCRTCRNGVPARVVATAQGQVWMHKACPEHGAQSVMLSPDAAWYERTRRIAPTLTPVHQVKKEVEHGCPFDCGPCASHKQKVRLPILTITSACNLDCPICYVHNKNEDAFEMEDEEFEAILSKLVQDYGELDLLNMTGGDPTLHPRFVEYLERAHEAGIHRAAICTNGIKLARDESLVARIAAAHGRVALSFDSFEDRTDKAMQGAKLLKIKTQCLDLLERYDVDTTLIPVMTQGYNDHEIGRIIDMGLSRPNVRHIEIHTMTYTGKGGASFDRSGRITMLEVLQRIEQTTHGLLRPSDFVPSPCAHPLCYQIAYLLMDPEGGAPVPFLRFMDAKTMMECLGDRLYLEPSPRLERAFLEAIDALWLEAEEQELAPTQEHAPHQAWRTLALIKRMLALMFPAKPLSRAQALKVSERVVKAIYVHSHMDEDSFDVERAALCCDSNVYADGSMIPVCNYNVLYRDKQARFMQDPLVWNERSGGRLSFAPFVWEQADQVDPHEPRRRDV